MRSRRIDGFFYGLFMDGDVLRQAGVDPGDFRRAWVDDFALRIGQRASLVPSPGARVYGMVVSLTHAEFGSLYGAAGLEAYRPEAVLAHTFAGDAVPALCYNLEQPPGSGEGDPAYVARLQAVLRALGFPEAYVESIG